MSVQTDVLTPTLRKPRLEDGADLWSLVKETGVLDVNAAYTYLMLCRNFQDTCVVAEMDNSVVGFVSAYIHPKQPDTLFVWQVGVSESQRGQGLATKMLQALLQRQSCLNIRYLETTISPSNKASQALFRKLARDFDAYCAVSMCFQTDQFPDDHESELLFKIGPFKKTELNTN
ncbi:L-2,4-diaminobutyric acid acetyltransferase [Caldalkalibacillus uzonensis]|uniref:L-2,4-diaminobutyric acid acetyltransferase n=1 Tax=Caldalkalibacillus uzonensis TaxID=353224 RepID=A0ABU0CN23_9BACI|nr:diaminobutyrate acetyltransferase [Caldalkalibacillus uzonensis]MDQ0337488.1 L-2,4-diaminobutyric acid acetyltransferase [Caldalkalibacillus uzonensis]